MIRLQLSYFSSSILLDSAKGQLEIQIKIQSTVYYNKYDIGIYTTGLRIGLSQDSRY